jgi:cobalt/nickel transport system permease protein
MVLPALVCWQVFALVRRLPWMRQPWFRSALVALSVFTWVQGVVFGVALVLASWGSDFQDADFAWVAKKVLHPVSLAGALLAGILAAWAERRLENAPEFPLGLIVGEVGVLLTVFLNCLVLIWGGAEDWHTLALVLLIAHLPIAVVEGIVLGFTVSLLARAKPDVLGWPGVDEKTPEGETSRGLSQVGKAVGLLLAVAGGLLIPAGSARAHALLIDWDILPGKKVQVLCRFSGRPRSFPARDAEVRVFGPQGALLAKGKSDQDGLFFFTYQKEEPLTIQVKHPGHMATAKLFDSAAGEVADATPGEVKPIPSHGSSADGESSWLKEMLIGVGFLLALAAFVLSVRNARQLRALRETGRR